MERLLWIVVGGIADHAVDGLGRRTPLQVARTPNLDHLAMLGGCGVYHPTRLGEPVSPSLSLFLMLGNPVERFPGEAAFEAIASGIKLEEGRYYTLIEPVYMQDSLLVERKPFASEEEEVDFYIFVKENILDITRVSVGTYMLETDEFVPTTHPILCGRKAGRLEDLPFDALAVSKWPQNEIRLSKGLVPINALLTYGSGRYIDCGVPHIPEQFIFITDSTFFKGIVDWMGFDIIFTRSDDPFKNLLTMFEEAAKRVKEENIFIYTDYIYRSSARFKAWKKVEIIEEIDKAFSYVIESFIPEDILIVVTSDVTAPCMGTKPYSGNPVPVLLVGEGVRRGMVAKFDEATSSPGSLGVLKGRELLLTVLSYLGKLNPLGL